MYIPAKQWTLALDQLPKITQGTTRVEKFGVYTLEYKRKHHWDDYQADRIVTLLMQMKYKIYKSVQEAC